MYCSITMLYLAISCVSRKGETGGAGWELPKGANCKAVSGLGSQKPLVGTG